MTVPVFSVILNSALPSINWAQKCNFQEMFMNVLFNLKAF